AETTFLLPPTQAGADYRLRIFTTHKEIAFAGHPTIGSAHVARIAGLVGASKTELVQECQAGLLSVRCEGEGSSPQYSVRVPRSRIVPHDEAATVLLDRALAKVERGLPRRAQRAGRARQFLPRQPGPRNGPRRGAAVAHRRRAPGLGWRPLPRPRRRSLPLALGPAACANKKGPLRGPSRSLSGER